MLPLYSWWKLSRSCCCGFFRGWCLACMLPSSECSPCCQKWESCFSLAFAHNWLFWFCARERCSGFPIRDSNPVMGFWKEANCSVRFVFNKGILSGPIEVWTKPWGRLQVEKISSLSPSLVCNNTLGCNNIHYQVCSGQPLATSQRSTAPTSHQLAGLSSSGMSSMPGNWRGSCMRCQGSAAGTPCPQHKCWGWPFPSVEQSVAHFLGFLVSAKPLPFLLAWQAESLELLFGQASQA